MIRRPPRSTLFPYTRSSDLAATMARRSPTGWRAGWSCRRIATAVKRNMFRTPSVNGPRAEWRSEEHTSELQSHHDLVCRLLLEKKKTTTIYNNVEYERLAEK